MTTSNGEPPSSMGPTQGALVGRRFGNYTAVQLLASGGMGEVYVLQHATLELTRVLKTILPEYAARQDIEERFYREAHSMAKLGKHPNIVGIEDFDRTDDGLLWMMMPFVPGVSLDAHLQAQGILAPYRILEMLCDVGLALDHAHQLGIIHRDIKPSNIRLDSSDGAYKLLDFGIARQRTAAVVSTTQMAIGTPSYMAVEQYEHASEADAPADIYALACAAWELECGEPPWTASDSAVLYHQKLHVPPASPRRGQMSSAREAFLRTCLQVNPALRPQSIRDFVLGYAATVSSPSPFAPNGLGLVERRARKLTERAASETTVRRPPGATTPFASVASAPKHTHTTLGSANGAVSAVGRSVAPRHSKLLGATAAAVVIGGLAAYGVASSHRGASAERPLRPVAQPIQPATKAPSVAAQPDLAPAVPSTVPADRPRIPSSSARGAVVVAPDTKPASAQREAAVVTAAPPVVATPETKSAPVPHETPLSKPTATRSRPPVRLPSTGSSNAPSGSGAARETASSSTDSGQSRRPAAPVEPKSSSKRKFDPDAFGSGSEENP